MAKLVVLSAGMTGRTHELKVDTTTNGVRRTVFDAPTTQGGSGGPIFNKNGQVIAVEYAVLPKFGGNSFGVPVTYALELLDPRRAGRKKPAA